MRRGLSYWPTSKMSKAISWIIALTFIFNPIAIDIAPYAPIDKIFGSVNKVFEPINKILGSAEAYATADTTPPTTSLSINPSFPTGENGWYKGSSPSITLSADETATVNYRWGEGNNLITNPTLTTCTNLVNDDPTVSMLSQSGLGAFTTSNCVDNDTATQAFYTDDSVAGSWLKVDNGPSNEKAYGKVRLYVATPGAANWKVQYSDDNTTWTDAATNLTVSAAGWNEKTWNYCGSHRYWRLYLTNTPGGGPWYLEMEWYSYQVADGWTKDQSPDHTATWSIDGGQKINLTASTAASYSRVYQDYTNITPGNMYSFRVKAKINNATNFCTNLKITFGNTDWSQVEVHEATLQQALTDYTTLKIENKTAPAWANRVRVGCYVYTQASGVTGAAWFKDVVLEKLTYTSANNTAGPFSAPEGINTLYYYSVDTAGNTESLKSTTIKVDTIAPNTPVLNSVDAITPTNVANVVVSGTSDLLASSVLVTASDGTNSVTTSTASSGSFSTTMDLSSLSDGTITFTATAKDQAGNESPISLAKQANKDIITPPITSLSINPSSPTGEGGWYKGSSPSITISANETATVNYRWGEANNLITNPTLTTCTNLVNDDPTVSMLSQSGLGAFTTSNCVDNDLVYGCFYTDDSLPGAYLKVDSGAGNEKAYGKVRIYASSGFGTSPVWDIEYSDDGTTWFKAATSFSEAGNGWSEKSWSSVGAHRYWRLLLMNTPGSGAWRTEVEWYSYQVADGWIASGDCERIFTIDGGQKIWTGGAGTWGEAYIYQDINAAPGENFDASCQAKVSSVQYPGFQAQLHVAFYNSSGQALSSYQADLSPDSTNWTLLQIKDIVAPANTTKIRILLKAHQWNDGWTTGAAWFKDVLLEKQSNLATNPTLTTCTNLVNDDPTVAMLSQSGLGAFTTSNCVDNDTATQAFYTDDSVAGSWLKIDNGAGNEKAYGKVRLYVATPGAANWKIQYSDDNLTWTDAATNLTVTAAGWNEKTWDYCSAHRYWRLYLTNTPGGGPWYLEMEWYSYQVADGWIASGDCERIFTIDGGQKIWTGGAGTWGEAYIYRDINCNPGDGFNVSCQSKVSAVQHPGFQAELHAAFYNGSGQAIGSAQVNLSPDNTNWRQLRIENRIAPANTTKIRILLKAHQWSDGWATGAAWFKDVVLEKHNTAANTAGPFSAPEGINTLYYYSVDSVGNTEAQKSITIKVDTIAPTIPVLNSVDTITPTNVANVVVSGTSDLSASSVVITASDGTNAVTKSTSSSGTFNTTMDLSSLSDGTITFTAIAKDEAGNESPISLAKQAKKDIITPPTTSLSINPPSPTGDNGWYKGSSPSVTLSADEAATINYRWDEPTLANDDPTVSMISQSGLGAFTTSNCVDNDTATQAFYTDDSVPGAYLKVDSGAGNEKAYGKVRLYVATAGVANWKIQYSDDNLTWTDAATNLTLAAGWNEKTWDYCSAHRYWRLYLTNTPGGGPWTNEMEWYTYQVVDGWTYDFNLISNPTLATCTSTIIDNPTAAMLSQSGLTDWRLDKVVNNAVDEGAWHTDTSVAGAWIKVDLGAGNAKAFGKVRTYSAYSAGSATWNIQYSDNNIDWFNAATDFAYAAAAGWNTKNWANVGAHRYWRLYLTNTPGGGPWMNEMEWYSYQVADGWVFNNNPTDVVNASIDGGQKLELVTASFNENYDRIYYETSTSAGEKISAQVKAKISTSANFKARLIIQIGNADWSQAQEFYADLTDVDSNWRLLQLNNLMAPSYATQVRISLAAYYTSMSATGTAWFKDVLLEKQKTATNSAGPLTAPEGINTLYYYSVDTAGNTEALKSTTVKVDTIAPTTTATLNGTLGSNGWYNSDVQIILSAADNTGGSGISKTEYSHDGKVWNTYTVPFTVSTKGITTVYYRSIDAAGNIEAKASETITLLNEDFLIFNSTQWVDATYLPQYAGRPQTIFQTTADGRSAIYMQTDETPSNKRRGIALPSTITASPNMTVEMAFKPVGDLDGVNEIWLYDQTTGKYLVTKLFAGNYGVDRAVNTDFSGYGIRSSAYPIFSFGEWLIFKIESKDNKTTIYLLDANRNEKWSTTYDAPLSNVLSDFNICLSQQLGTPSSGTYPLKAYIDYIKVTETTSPYKTEAIKIEATGYHPSISPRDDLGTESFWNFYSDGLGDDMGCSVNTFNGNLVVGKDLFTVPGRGFDLSEGLVYNSLSTQSGPLGWGWKLENDQYIKENTDGSVTFKDEDGTNHKFTKNADGTYKAPNGVYLTLTKQDSTTFTIKDKSNSVFKFQNGLLTSITDERGNIASYGYIDETLASITDPSGRKVTYTYENGKLKTITYPTNRTVTFGYDPNGYLTSAVDSKNGVTKFGYDTSGRLSTVTDANNHVTSFSYHSDNKAYKINDARSTQTTPYSTTFDYYYESAKTNPYRATITDPAGNSTHYYHNSAGNPTEIYDHSWAFIGSFNWDKHNLTKESDAKGSTSSTYDSNGNVTSVSDTLDASTNAVTSAQYDSQHNPTTITDPNNNQVQVRYDQKSNTISVVSPARKEADANTYDIYGNPTSYTRMGAPTYNRLLNPSFERLDQSGKPEFWNLGENASAISIDTSKAATSENLYGKQSVKISSATQTTAYLNSQSVGDISTSQKLTLSVNAILEGISAPAGSGGVAVGIEYYKPNATNPSQMDFLGSDYSNYYIGSGATTLVVTSTTIPAGTTSAKAVLRFKDATGTVYFDAAQLETPIKDDEGHILTKFDYVENSSFESQDAASIWTAYPATSGTAAIATQNPWAGTRSARIEHTSTGVDRTSEIKSQKIPVRAGEELTLSGYVKTEAIVSKNEVWGPVIFVYYYDSNDSLIKYDYAGTRQLGTKDYTRYATATTVPSSAAYAAVSGALYKVDSGTAYFDNIKLEPRSTTKYTYTSDGNYLSKITDPLGSEASFDYYDSGNLKTITDPKGNTTSYTHDLLDNLTSVTDAYGKIFRYGFDPMSLQVTYRDARSASELDNAYKTTYNYNELNQPISIIDPLGKQTTYKYNSRGNLEEILHPTNYFTALGYDSRNRLAYKYTGDKNSTYSNIDNANFNDPTSFRFYYDDANNLRQVNSYYWQDLLYQYDYDMANRLKSSTNCSRGYTLNYAYDKSGNVTSITDSDSKAVGYTYGSYNQLLTLTDTLGNKTYYRHDEEGRTFETIKGNGVKSVYTYDKAGRIAQIADPIISTGSPGTSTLYNYSYDKDGNIVQIQSSTLNERFAYDKLNRLTEWFNGETTTTYEYDCVGNLTKYGNKTFTYDAANQMTNSGFVYNSTGLLLKDDRYNYGYDWGNQLLEVRNKSDIRLVKYYYDYRGLLKEKQLYSNDVYTSSIYYDWDDFGRLIREQNGSAITRYTYDANNRLVAIEKGGQMYYVHTNHRGDILSITDSSKAIVATYKYDPWGKIISKTGTFDQPFRYAGYYYDEETGLYYLKSRFYNPELGRFLTKDTVLGVNADPRTLNLYAYCGNNPVMSVDPDGHKYDDINVTIPVVDIFGVTFGYMKDKNKKRYLYVGPAITFGPSVSVTHSEQDVSEGWNYAISGITLPTNAAQVGKDSSGNSFVEGGGGLPPGVSLSAFNVGKLVKPKPTPKTSCHSGKAPVGVSNKSTTNKGNVKKGSSSGGNIKKGKSNSRPRGRK